MTPRGKKSLITVKDLIIGQVVKTIQELAGMNAIDPQSLCKGSGIFS